MAALVIPHPEEAPIWAWLCLEKNSARPRVKSAVVT